MSRLGAYPVVDLFAGPGGLGEGFAACHSEENLPRFRNVVSIERDTWSHSTLKLRHFFRELSSSDEMDDYYRYLDSDIELSELYRRHPGARAEADKAALKISLGDETHTRVKEKIRERLSGSKRWVLVGGPPCQAYSLVGRSRMRGNPSFESDERHFLYREYLKVIADHRPPIFVMENVKGLLSAKIQGEPVIQKIVADLRYPGKALGRNSDPLAYRLYSLSHDELPNQEVDPRLFLVKAEEFGVPQARHRMFIFGVRNDIKVKPRQLRARHAPSVRDVIGRLPAVRSGVSRVQDEAGDWWREIASVASRAASRELRRNEEGRLVLSRMKALLEKGAYPEHRSDSRQPRSAKTSHDALKFVHDPRLRVLKAHETRSHMPSDLRRYFYAATFAETTKRSPKLSDFPNCLLPNHRNVDKGAAGEMFSDRFRVQLPDAVATTITSHISKDGNYFIHYDPTQCRSLTVREAARLQTFPDNYVFLGPRTQQYHQVGNAVPPFLAMQIAEIVAEVLDAAGSE